MQDEPSQFVRVEAYSLSKSKHPRNGKLSVQQVLEEALRAEGAHPHIAHPRAPRILFGSFDGLLARLEAGAAQATQMGPKGKPIRQRIDTPVLLGLVSSHPSPPGSAGVDKWEGDGVAFLRRYFGDRLVAVLAHDDEAHAHLHAYIHDDGKSVKRLHPGYAAELACHANSPGRVRSGAYRKAMRSFQDEHWREVGKPNGLERMSANPRRRLPRPQILAYRNAKQLLAEEFEKLEEERRALAAREKAVRAMEKELSLTKKRREQEFEAREKKLSNVRSELHAYTVKLQEFFNILKAREDALGPVERAAAKARLQQIQAEQSAGAWEARLGSDCANEGNRLHRLRP